MAGVGGRAGGSSTAAMAVGLLRPAAGTLHPMTSPSPAAARAEVTRALVAVVVARTGINAGIRVIFPFLPAIARGLDTSLATLGILIALRSLVGLTAPSMARLAERLGRRDVMLVGLIATAAGSALAGIAPTVAVLGAGWVLVGLGKPGFDVPMQGWFGARVPYARRGRVLGLTELTWAGGLLASVPLSGWLIARTSWRAQFAVVVVLCLLGTIAVRLLMADDRPTHRERRPLRLTTERAGMLAVVFLFGLAAEGLFVVYGAWLEDDLGFDVATIGVFTLLVVAAELAGEGGVAAFGDRLGLRRSVRVALLVSAIAYGTLPFVGSSVPLAIGVVVVWFVAYEVTIVSSVPFVTELGGEGRDRLIGLMVATLALARAAGALLAPRLFVAGGIGAMAALSCACVLAALVVLTTVVGEPRPSAPLPG